MDGAWEVAEGWGVGGKLGEGGGDEEGRIAFKQSPQGNHLLQHTSHLLRLQPRGQLWWCGEVWCRVVVRCGVGW